MERDHLEYLGIYRKILLKRMFKKWDGVIDWIDLAEDRGRWRVF